ncbi:extracellular solute-binding protein [Nocardioides humi]|uniref:Extracellular solute-binding protein n=1 Tax=Nocardioides humi TaxID=449461 RepID=A0ABN2A845_9ACTN
MKVGRFVAVATSVAAVVTLAGCGDSSEENSAKVKEAAQYSGDDRQGYLEECAKEEGSLSVYSAQQTDLWQPLKEGFQKKYPGIKVETTRRTSAETAETLSKEAQAGVNKADVIDVKVEVAESLLDLFAPFSSPELEAYPETAIGPDSKYVISDQIPYGIIYNTDKVPNPPKTSEDLLKPEFKGHIAMSTTLLGTQWVGWMENKYGEEFLERFGEQDVRTTDANTDAIIAQVAAGEALVAPGVNLSGVEALKQQSPNAPVEWLPVDPQWTQGALSMAAKAPHPCAAMLYIDYELSAEGQTINPLYLSAREDAPTPDVVQGENEPVDIWEIVGEHSAQAYQDASRRWTELVDRYIIK